MLKKKFVALASAALIALSAPVVAIAAPTTWTSPSGAVKAETIVYSAPSGVSVRAGAACNGTGSLTVEGTADTKAANLPENLPEGFSEIASFKVTSSGDVEAPYQFAYSLGTEYAGAEVTVYVDHEGKADNETITQTAGADGTVTFTTDELSVHTITAKKAANKTTTDTSSKSPQTGIDSSAVVMGTAAAAVVAAGAAVALRKKVSE